MRINRWTAETQPLRDKKRGPFSHWVCKIERVFWSFLPLNAIKIAAMSSLLQLKQNSLWSSVDSGRAVHDEVVYLFTLFIFYFFLCIGNMGYILIQAPHKTNTKERETLYKRLLPLISFSEALLCWRALRDLCIAHQSDPPILTIEQWKRKGSTLHHTIQRPSFTPHSQKHNI